MWIVGSSYLVRARRFLVERRVDWPSDCLWLARGGMRWAELMPLLEHQRQLSTCHPAAIVVHLGSNDLVNRKASELHLAITEDLLRLRLLFPQTKIIWSDILPRRHWQGAVSSDAIDLVRRKLNRRLANRVTELGGLRVAHPRIKASDSSMYCWDGVHLSSQGLSLFTNTILNALMP